MKIIDERERGKKSKGRKEQRGGAGYRESVRANDFVMRLSQVLSN